METRFADVLEAVESLPAEEKEMLVDIVQHRLIEDRRKIIKAETEQAQKDFVAGLIKPASVDEIMGDILS